MTPETNSDEYIKKNVVNQLYWNNEVDAADISVQVEDGEVILEGSVPSYNAKTTARDTALDVEGVKAVSNKLEISFSPGEEKPADTEIQSRIRDTLIWDTEIDSSRIESEVDGGFVTLRGNVDELWKKFRVENKISDLQGVIGVTNELSVVPTEDFIDEDIAEDLMDSLERNLYVNPDDIDVRVEDGEVFLSGTVFSHRAKNEAYDSALRTAGVTRVEDNLVVKDEAAAEV